MAKLLSDKFREAIDNADFADDKLTGLYQAVNGMSDEDFKEYMYVNRGYFKQNMPVAVDEIEGFQQYVSEEPSWGVANIDYEKVTGTPDALDKFNEYDMKDMEYFGSKVGMTGKEFLHQMAKDKTEQDRRRIAHGEDEGGWFESPTAFAHNTAGAFMNVMAPRTQEAIERGDEPSAKDIALDVAVDAAQTLPVGKIAKVSAAAKPFSMRNVLANAAVPVASEVADAVAYDDENPRGTFDPIDAAKGTAVNVVVPRTLRQYGSETWSNVGKNVSTKNVPFMRSVLAKGPIGDISDITSNKIGDVIYANRATPMPVVGPLMEKYRKEKDTKKEKEKKKESATRKYLIGEK